MEYFSAVRRSEIGSFVETRMNLECAIHSEISQKKTNRYRTGAYMWHLEMWISLLLCLLTFLSRKMLWALCSRQMNISSVSASDKSFPVNVITRWGFLFPHAISHFLNWILYFTIDRRMKSSTFFIFSLIPKVRVSRVLCPQHQCLLLSRAVPNGENQALQNFHFAEKHRIPQGFPSTGLLVMCVPELTEKFN